MMQRIKFNYDASMREIYQLVRQEVQLTCPRCNSDLEVALTPEEAKKKKMRTGIFCPKNENHVAVLLEFNLSQFWDDFDKGMKDSEAERQKV